jgi:hypothetical protein
VSAACSFAARSRGFGKRPTPGGQYLSTASTSRPEGAAVDNRTDEDLLVAIGAGPGAWRSSTAAMSPRSSGSAAVGRCRRVCSRPTPMRCSTSTSATYSRRPSGPASPRSTLSCGSTSSRDCRRGLGRLRPLVGEPADPRPRRALLRRGRTSTEGAAVPCGTVKTVETTLPRVPAEPGPRAVRTRLPLGARPCRQYSDLRVSLFRVGS